MPRFLHRPEPLGSGRRAARGRAGLAEPGDDVPSAHGDGPDDAPATGQVTRVGPPPPVPPPSRPAPGVRPPAPAPEPDEAVPPTGELPLAAAGLPVVPPLDGIAAEQPLAPTPDAPAPAAGPVPPVKATGRAGRDLGSAIGVGLGLGAVILAALLVWRPAFLVVISAAVLVAIWELTGALGKGGHRPPRVPLLVGAVAMVALAWTRGGSGLVVGFLLTVFAVLLWRLGDGPARYLDDAATAVFVAFYIPLLAGFAVLLLVPDDGAARVLTFIATVVCSDVGGYAAGVLFGRHAMAPTVSPKKSWEGLGGSVAACVLIGTLVVTLTFHGPWWGGALYGVAIALTATAGDLGESLIKRDLGIKDMGTILPGHGGIMDRMDSLLPSAAIAYLILSAVVPA
ncbi:phosphatidate cytidylyltransferase [Modestobacter sp. NPDC049651]|uniref:phosphatidate cytidylyltransferase n=1 Tax=unclassified Modestobacter TaxID=2643866 RepID=UPI0033C03DB7